MSKRLFILGIRGLPARHGGFETFAERLCQYLVNKGWDVTVYCQELGRGPVYSSVWHGVNRVHIPINRDGALSTVLFDLRAVWHALGQDGLFLTLGYNTALFNTLQRLKGQVNIINMDGIEWRRNKWGPFAKTWFWLNERIGCWVGNHLIADHPKIKQHLATRVSADKITMIPYGGDEVLEADVTTLVPYGLEPGGFSVIIARPEPENSFLEIVRAFSCKHRAHKLVVLGKFDPVNNCYHRQVMEAASAEVLFPGAIYEASVVQALRYFSRFYLHGHRVGGTNPSLVEALGAGSAVVAQDNPYNRWVAGEGAVYFKGEQDLASLLDDLLRDDRKVAAMKFSSSTCFRASFTWAAVLREYEALLSCWLSRGTTS